MTDPSRFDSSRWMPPSLFALILAAACGGTTPEPTSAAPVASAPSAAPAAEPAPSPAASAAEPAPSAATPAPAPEAEKAPDWDSLSHEQKLEIMKTKVLPTMKEKFQSFDPKRFAQFSCMTCHGKSAKERQFKMPNPDLPKLDPKVDFGPSSKKDPKIMAFMQGTVEPTVASLVGEAPYDMKTNQGFGCFECHTMAGK